MKELIIGNVTVEGGTLPGNLVTTDTDQTITGQKTFSGNQSFTGELGIPGGMNAVRVPEWREDQRDDYLGIQAGNRFSFGRHRARGVNAGSLLISNAWADHTRVPENGIYSKGNISTDGNFSGNGVGLTNLNASSLSTGTIPQARLGMGTGSSTTFLRGDGIWATPPGGAGNVVGMGVTVSGLGNANNLETILLLLTSFNQTAIAGIGEMWGTPVRALLGDPDVGGWATCYARRISFADESHVLRADRGIIEIVAANPFGAPIKKGWLYRVHGSAPFWTGWRNV